MSRKICVIVCLLVMFSLQICYFANAETPATPANNDVKIFVNNEEVTSEYLPCFVNGKAAIPVRLITELLNLDVPIGFVAQAFGLNIVWDTNTRSIYIETKYSP